LLRTVERGDAPPPMSLDQLRAVYDALKSRWVTLCLLLDRLVNPFECASMNFSFIINMKHAGDPAALDNTPSNDIDP